MAGKKINKTFATKKGPSGNDKVRKEDGGRESETKSTERLSYNNSDRMKVDLSELTLDR